MHAHPAPPDTDRTEERLVDLETKASFTEDLLDRLNEEIVRQQQQIDLLRREVTRLSRQAGAGDAGGLPNPRDELPPHY
jgi:SlyX protein